MHFKTFDALQAESSNAVDIIIVFVLLTSPLVIMWLIRGQKAPTDEPPPSLARDTRSWLPAQPGSVSTPEVALPKGMSWSVLDDYQVARLLSGSDPRTNAD